MHIMHVLGNFGNGGAEMGVVRLIKNYPDPKVRHSVCSIGSNMALSVALPSSVECCSLGIEGRSPFAFGALHKLFKAKQVQVAHVNNLAPWLDSLVAAKLANSACIQTFHGIEDHLLQYSAVKSMIYRTAAKMSCAVTAVSSPAAALLNKTTGIPLPSIQVIPNGIDVDAFMPATHAEEKFRLRMEFGLPRDAIVFGCVAALRPVKNHEGLLRAFAEVCRESNGSRPLPYLALVGAGPLEASLRIMAQELNCTEQVLFLGLHAEKNVQKLLRTFDVFVLNSFTEGLSYALLEAMASGLPSVVTAVGANPDLVHDGQEGFVVSVGDVEGLANCLRRMVDKVDVLPAMGAAARQKAEEYSSEQMIAAYAALYDAVARHG